jgi:cell division protein FtsI (penicillin-binding protein 3)/stage V sporulation protein D (sporulation-specific penicillin-binding protein)
MVWVVQKLQKQLFSEYVKKFGFGERTGIDLDNEVGGSFSDLKNINDVGLATMAFGQGLSVTPLQMLNAYIALANNGKLMQPYVVEKIVNPNGKTYERKSKTVSQVIKPETAAKITQMLISVVINGHGKKAQVPGYQIAGKTGTAQIPDLVHGGYLEGQNIGSFAGYFPANNPKYVLLVKMDTPKNVAWAEESAAPLFGKIAKWLLEYYQVPTTEAIK